MTSRILRVSTFFVALAIGIGVSPIRFTSTEIAHGVVLDGGGFFWVHKYRSMYFVDLWHEGAGYETAEKAAAAFEADVGNPDPQIFLDTEILERTAERALIHVERRDGLQGYCILKVKDTSTRRICSTSLIHILDFERQKY